MQKEITAGDILGRARLQANLTLEDVEKSTFISQNTLKALESNSYGFFRSRINAELLAKKYAKFLGQNEETVASLLRRDFIENSPILLSQPDLYTNPKIPRLDNGWRFGMLLVICSIIFFTYQIYLFAIPPKLLMLEPQGVEFKRVEKIFVKGTVDTESQVSVNGTRATIDLGGIFVSEVLLKKGENIIKIEVIGANGRKTNKEIKVVNNF